MAILYFSRTLESPIGCPEINDASSQADVDAQMVILENLAQGHPAGNGKAGESLDQQPPNADKVIDGGGEEVILLDAIKGGTVVDWRTFPRREDGLLRRNKAPS